MTLETIHAVGWRAKDFALQGTDGKTYSLADIAAATARWLCSSAIIVLM